MAALPCLARWANKAGEGISAGTKPPPCRACSRLRKSHGELTAGTRKAARGASVRSQGMRKGDGETPSPFGKLHPVRMMAFHLVFEGRKNPSEKLP